MQYMTKTPLLYLIFMCSYFTSTTTPSLKADTIILGGGCFWCLEAAYKLLPGVTHITSGYAGERPLTQPTSKSVVKQPDMPKLLKSITILKRRI